MKEISVTDLAALDNPVIIDVREPDEVAEVAAKGTIHIPLGEVEQRLDEIPADGPVYFICQGGGRSGRIAKHLEETRGLETVNVLGGTSAWVEAGLPVTRG